MSHEGIRIVTADQREREEAAARAEELKLSPDAVTPKKIRVMKTEGTGVTIEWKDGHTSSWTFPWLRHACPCATCHEERQQDGRKPGEAKQKPKQLLVLYEPPPRPKEIEPVGNYALKFRWEDGHESGIYSWAYLRRVCNCPSCAEKSKSEEL
jgi:DUF971 family protein